MVQPEEFLQVDRDLIVNVVSPRQEAKVLASALKIDRSTDVDRKPTPPSKYDLPEHEPASAR